MSARERTQRGREGGSAIDRERLKERETVRASERERACVCGRERARKRASGKERKTRIFWRVGRSGEKAIAARAMRDRVEGCERSVDRLFHVLDGEGGGRGGVGRMPCRRRFIKNQEEGQTKVVGVSANMSVWVSSIGSTHVKDSASTECTSH